MTDETTLVRRRRWFWTLAGLASLAVVAEVGFDASAYWPTRIRGHVMGGDPARPIAGAVVVVQTTFVGLIRGSNEAQESYATVTRLDGSFELSVQGQPRSVTVLHEDYATELCLNLSLRTDPEGVVRIGIAPLPYGAPRTRVDRNDPRYVWK